MPESNCSKANTSLSEEQTVDDGEQNSDANNNTDNIATTRQLTVSEQEKFTQTQSEWPVIEATGSECNTSDSNIDDGWHLLDADNTSDDNHDNTSDVQSNNLIEESDDNLNRRNVGGTHKKIKRKRNISQTSQRLDCLGKTPIKRHIKVASGERMENEFNNDLLARDEKLSPILVSACTILYALMPLISFWAFIALIALLFTKYWLVTVLYATYLILDSNTCNKGGRRVEFVYKSKFWSYLAAYFPIRLIYSQNFKLNPNENYILNYHPHGISAFGCVSAFATNGLNFNQRFPGIRARFMVHETSFLVPVMRETFSLRGDCSVNSKSFDYILSQKHANKKSCSNDQNPVSGNLLALCGGGLAEADLSDAHTLKIVVLKRKGFVKKALIHGAHLIPCIAFGENSAFKKVNLKPGSLLHRLETSWYNLFKFKHPIYYGQSMFFGEKRNGALPFKRPINVVMGDPIEVDRVEEPTQGQIDELHAIYIERLQAIFSNAKSLGMCTQYDIKLELI